MAGEVRYEAAMPVEAVGALTTLWGCEGLRILLVSGHAARSAGSAFSGRRFDSGLAFSAPDFLPTQSFAMAVRDGGYFHF